jgi:D-aminoacyl-tRNA deacylase
MRAVVQRVQQAQVTIGEHVAGKIGAGVVILIGIAKTDAPSDAVWLADKITKLRIFADKAGAMNRSLADTQGGALVVSQFTLHARTRKGTRPSFNDAASPEIAVPCYERFITELRQRLGAGAVATGEFGAMMQVSLVNDGPVTLIVDTPEDA